MKKLLPSVLKELWQTVDEEGFTSEQYNSEKERLLDECRSIWSQALILDGEVGETEPAPGARRIRGLR